MRGFDFLIIGGGAAGTTAAGLLRVMNPDSSIGILMDEPYEFYSRVLLSKYIRGEVEKAKVFLKDEAWYLDNKVELIKGARAKSLNTAEKIVTCQDGQTYGFGKLLIAVGARAIKLSVPGVELENIDYMWTLGDAEKIVGGEVAARKGVVIGGGFIGLEFAHTFRKKGIETTIIDAAPNYWGNRLRKNSSEVIAKMLSANGVSVVTGEMVERFEPKADGKSVGKIVCKSGKVLECDLVGIGVGIKSDLGWLEGSGVEVAGGGVVANEFLETTAKDVYAAGDCVSFEDRVFETRHIVATWANATTQGVVVAKTMSGTKTTYEAVSFYTINFFGGSCSFVGMTEADFADEIIERGSVESGKITEIFIKTIDGIKRVVGAIIVNEAGDTGVFTSIIRNKVNIAGKEQNLASSAFDLKSLL